MKTSNLKFSILFLLLPLMAFAGSEGHIVDKQIKRNFSITTDGLLAIENRYGSIDVTIGSSNQINVEVNITVESSSLKKAQETLDRISIDFAEGQNKVSAVTGIQTSSGFMSWFDNDNVKMDIDYKVLVPADIYLQLINKYGGIYVETTNRELKIDLSYGDIRLGDIAAKLQLRMAYSDGSLSNIKDGNIDISYSDLEMEDAQRLNVMTKYSDLTMGSAKEARIDASYSDIKGGDIDKVYYQGKYSDALFEQVTDIEFKSSYTDLDLASLRGNGTFTMTYGDLEVSNIAAGFSKILLNTSYVGAELDFADNASFSVDAQNAYCDINHYGLKVMEDIQKAGSSTLRASKGSGGGQVVARMNYGDLKIR